MDSLKINPWSGALNFAVVWQIIVIIRGDETL
jgi:hypothetical protein